MHAASYWPRDSLPLVLISAVLDKNLLLLGLVLSSMPAAILAFWDSILERIVISENCFKMAHCVAAIAVTNNLSVMFL